MALESNLNTKRIDRHIDNNLMDDTKLSSRNKEMKIRLVAALRRPFPEFLGVSVVEYSLSSYLDLFKEYWAQNEK